MSGGYFDYTQYKLEYIIDEIEQIIEGNHKEDGYGYSFNYSDITIDRFKEAIFYLKVAKEYTQRIDWLVSDDDNEEDFHRRLGEKLEELGIIMPWMSKYETYIKEM